MKQIYARALLPMTISGIRRTEGNRIVPRKSTEMIDSDRIIKLRASLHSADPPAVSCLSVIIPVVQRIPPELSVSGKCIRRTSRDPGRFTVTVELEELPACPAVRAVHCHIDRNISDNADFLPVRIILQCLPLLREFKLQEAVVFYLCLELTLRRL